MPLKRYTDEYKKDPRKCPMDECGGKLVVQKRTTLMKRKKVVVLVACETCHEMFTVAFEVARVTLLEGAFQSIEEMYRR